METCAVSAMHVHQDDHFFIAGTLYRVNSVFSGMDNPKVQIHFYDAAKRVDETEPTIHMLEVSRHTMIQVIRY